MKLHSRIRGEGAPVVLLHGLFGDGDNLTKLALALSERYQVHSLDARNHGRSPRSAQHNYPLMVADLIEYLDAQSLESVRIVGHSMGGKTAMLSCLSHPDRFEQAVIADIAPVTYPPHHQQIFKALESVNLDEIKSRAEAERSMSDYLDDPMGKQFLLKSLTRTHDGGYDWRFNLDVLIDQYEEILTGQPETMTNDLPILFIAGGDSDYIQREYVAGIQHRFPNARFKLISGTGHWLHAEKPETFNGLVMRFFQNRADMR